jgi:hypothetical protein
MRALALAFVLGMCSCLTLEHGLAQAQRGLAYADTSARRTTAKYVQAVHTAREACSRVPDPDACERRVGVDDESVEHVIRKAEQAGDAYDGLVILLRDLGDSMDVLRREEMRLRAAIPKN